MAEVELGFNDVDAILAGWITAWCEAYLVCRHVILEMC